MRRRDGGSGRAGGRKKAVAWQLLEINWPTPPR